MCKKGNQHTSAVSEVHELSGTLLEECAKLSEAWAGHVPVVVCSLNIHHELVREDSSQNFSCSSTGLFITANIKLDGVNFLALALA